MCVLRGTKLWLSSIQAFRVWESHLGSNMEGASSFKGGKDWFPPRLRSSSMSHSGCER